MIKKKALLLIFMLFMLLTIPSVSAQLEFPGIITIEGRPIEHVWLIAGLSFVLMLISAAFLSNQVEKVSSRVGRTLGIILLATSSSIPLLTIVITAGISKNFDIALSNVISTNIANLTLVIGLIALMRPLEIKEGFAKGLIAFFIISSSLIFAILSVNFLDGISFKAEGDYIFSSQEGILMIALFLLFVFIMRIIKAEAKEPVSSKESIAAETLLSIISGVAVCYFAYTCITALIHIARYYAVSEIIIGSTIVVVGTSFPEFAVALMLLFQHKDEVIFSNLITSNIINFLVGIGIVALITPVLISKSLIAFNLPFMVLANIFVMPSLLKGTLSRTHAMILIILFAVYIAIVFFGGVSIIPI